MANNSKPIKSLIGRTVEHDYSHYRGVITKTRADIRGYCYFVKWDTEAEQNNWFQLNVLIPLDPPQSRRTHD